MLTRPLPYEAKGMTHKAEAKTHEAEAKTHKAEAEVKFTRLRFKIPKDL